MGWLITLKENSNNQTTQNSINPSTNNNTQSTPLDLEINIKELKTALHDYDAELNYYKRLGYLVQELQKNLPVLTINYPFFKQVMPRGYINPQSVMIKGLHPVDTYLVDAPDNLILPLDYSMQYPIDIAVTQAPFWDILPGETLEFYHAFRLYAKSKYTNENFSRSIQGIAKELEASINYISALSKIYHWRVRALGYDMWYEKQRYNQQKQLIFKVTNKNSKIAGELLDNVLSTLQNKMKETGESAELSNMPITSLITLMEKLMAIERLNIGLEKHNPHNIEGINDVLVKQIANSKNNMEANSQTIPIIPNSGRVLTLNPADSNSTKTVVDKTEEAMRIADILKTVQHLDDKKDK